jgi:hypothetical protein
MWCSPIRDANTTDNEMNAAFYVRESFVRKLVIAGTVRLDLLGWITVSNRSLTLGDWLSGNWCLMGENGYASGIGVFDAIELIPRAFQHMEVMAENIDHIMMARRRLQTRVCTYWSGYRLFERMLHCRRNCGTNEYDMRHGMETQKTEYVVRQLTLKDTTVSSV